MSANLAISDIAFNYSGNGSSWVSWRTRDARYHFNLDAGRTEYNGETLYKNSLAKHGEPGWHDARKLDGSKAHNAKMIARVMEAVKSCDMIAKAKAEYYAKEAAERAEQLNFAKRREQARELFGAMRVMLKVGSVPITLSGNDVEALLSYAPKDDE